MQTNNNNDHALKIIEDPGAQSKVSKITEAQTMKQKSKVLSDEEQQRIDDSTFSITIPELSKILDQYRTRLQGDDDLKEMESLGGDEGILAKLKTDRISGVSSIENREEQFGSNKLFEKPIPHFCHYVAESLKDTMLQLLMIAAAVQIVLGATLSDEPERDWVDGVSILIAVVVVVTVSSVTDWKKEHQFKDLSDEQKKETKFGVVRNGITTNMQADDILVGDVITVNYGEILPADAILIDGNNVKADESALTGESKELKKMTYQECIDKREEEIKEGNDIKKVTLPSPVLLSGTNIISGSGHGLIIAVGKYSQKGQIRNMVENAQEDGQTPLEQKLESIASQIGKFGIVAGCVTLVALFIRFGINYVGKTNSFNDTSSTNSILTTFVQNFPDLIEQNKGIVHHANVTLTNPKLQIGGEILNIILLCVSIIVVAIPEGLPLAVTLSLAFSIRKMMDKQNLVRKMHACETMGGANIICTDKTGTLTKNEMTVTKIYDCKKEINLQKLNNQGAVGKLEVKQENVPETQSDRPLLNQQNLIEEYFTMKYFDLLKIGLGVNIVATINDLNEPNEKGRTEEITECNKTDFAFVNFLYLLNVMINPIRKKYYPENGTVKQIPFSSKRKRMSTLIASSEFPTGYRLFTKGGADFLLKNVTKYVDPETLSIHPFDNNKNNECLEQMKKFNDETLRTLSICYKDISKSEYESFKSGAEDDPSIDKRDLILCAIFGIKDILRPTVPNAVEQCHTAGVNVIMVTGDNLYTAVAIAKECNILNAEMDISNKIEQEPSNEIKDQNEKDKMMEEVLQQQPYAMTGTTFYNIIGGLICETCKLEAEKECKCAKTADEAKHLGKKEVRKDAIGNMENFKKITENLCVLARSQPVHKYSLVLGLKALKNVVAVTGDGTNDAPALSRSDVGFAMGKAGTDIAKEASDIIILDDDFSSIVVAILWGRNIYDNIRKFLQFQLTVNFCACILVFICACIGNETPLKPIQMLWVNLIMDSLGSLCLATESPYDELLLRKPTKRHESIINGKMWKHIIFQALFQLGVLLFLYLYAPYFVKENDPVRLSENAIIQMCYSKLPGDTKIDNIIHGSSAYWTSDDLFNFELDENICGEYSNKQDLSVAYKYYNSSNSGSVHMTLMFNVFVLYTLFNQINSRILDDSFNIFKRIFSNLYFPIIFLVEAALQVLIIFFGRSAFHTTERGLTGEQWGISIGFGAITFVVSIIAKLIPIDKCIQNCLDKSAAKEELMEEENEKEKDDNNNKSDQHEDENVSVNTNQKLIQNKMQGVDQSDKQTEDYNVLVNEIQVGKKNDNKNELLE